MSKVVNLFPKRYEESTKQESSCPLDPLQWVSFFLSDNGYTYDYKTDSVRKDGERISEKTIMSKMNLACHSTGSKRLRSFLKDAFHIWRCEQARNSLKNLRSSTAFANVEDDPMKDWVLATTGQCNLHDVAILKHFIWQVKRKISGLEVDHHIMPILFGKSGAGKSVAVQKLIQPLMDFALISSMSVLKDRFGKRQLSRNFIMFFDELEGAGSVDVNSLKQIITAPSIEWREMHSEGIKSSPQNCTFIGCSNDPVRDRIQDSTSARRFWQLNCQDRIDWETINDLNYDAMWKSIDENLPSPIIPLIDEINKIQNREIRATNLIEDWLTTSCKPACFTNKSPTTKELYQDFKDWCQWQGIISYPGIQKFARSLVPEVRSIGWDIESKHGNRGTIWPLKIDSNHV